MGVALHFNTNIALIVGYTITVIGALLSRAGALGGSCAAMFVTPITICTLLCVRKILFCRQIEPTIFLDKTCIDQEDVVRKLRGIQKLAAFLKHSSSMLICYSNVYLTKLWTVYEMAAYIIVGDVQKMHIFPTSHAQLICMLTSLGYLLSLGSLLVEMPEIKAVATELVPLLTAVFFRRTAMQIGKFYEKMECFSVKAAHCYVESDRTLVESNIVALMKGTGRVH